MSSTVATLSYQFSHLILRKILRGCYFNLQIRYKNQDRLDYAVVIDSPRISGAYSSLWLHVHGRCMPLTGWWTLGVWAILTGMTWRPKLTEQPSSRKLSVSVPEGKRTLQGLNPTTICSGPEIAHVTHNPLARTSHIHSPVQTKEVKKYSSSRSPEQGQMETHGKQHYRTMELRLREVKYSPKITYAVSDRASLDYSIKYLTSRCLRLLVSESPWWGRSLALFRHPT